MYFIYNTNTSQLIFQTNKTKINFKLFKQRIYVPISFYLLTIIH